MEATVCVEQKGTVENISRHRMTVRIHREALCGHCSAKGLCYIGEGSDRMVEIEHSDMEFKTGEEVKIVISRNSGNKAVVFGYLIPFLLLITALLTLTSLGIAEWITGLSSLALLVPYFLVLYLLRDKMRNTFALTVRKLH